MGAVLHRYATDCELLCRSVECFLLHYFNAQPYSFAVVDFPDVAVCFTFLFQRVTGYFCGFDCADVALRSCCFCSGLLTWSADNYLHYSDTLYNNE